MDNDISGVMGGTFDPNTVEGGGQFEPLPAGWYPVIIDKAEVTATKAGTGHYIKLAMSIVGETFANRKLFANINIQNPNATCVEIGQRELASLALGCGINALTSTDQLLGKTALVKVKIRKEEGHEPDNDVCGYKAPGTQPPAAQAAAPATPAVQPAVAPVTQPQAAPAAGVPAGGLPWG